MNTSEELLQLANRCQHITFVLWKAVGEPGAAENPVLNRIIANLNQCVICDCYLQRKLIQQQLRLGNVLKHREEK